MIRLIALGIVIIIISSCKKHPSNLPYIGNSTLIDGKVINYSIPEWSLARQDSVMVTNKELHNHIYVADFFFTSCPSICPKVMKQMLRIQEEFKDDERLKLLSFSIDPKRDTESHLTSYATNIGAIKDKWWFLRGEKDQMFDIANDYFVAAFEDSDVPGGFDHSGKIILVDRKGHIRSFSEGTDPSTTPKLIRDIKLLLSLEFN